ncbi:MAG: cation diffusion facilitator family transporter [Candidatus Kryptoniota bacterium]
MLKKNAFERKLLYSIVLNGLIFATELAGGLLANSLALISDALHNFSDFVSLIISLIASRMMTWSGNEKKSYGYFRVEILAALINSVTLVLIGLYIIYEAIERISSPAVIQTKLMLIIAAIGLTANLLSVLLLKPHRLESLNARSAFLHLFTDALESAAVIVTAILISLFNLRILDAIISIVIGIFIIKGAWDLLVESVNILTEGSPKGIDLKEVANFIKSYPGVQNIHHLHIWSLSSNFRALSAHIVVKDMPLSKTAEITKGLELDLQNKYGIDHPTFQLEANPCEEDLIVQYREKNGNSSQTRHSSN